jgi:hypothetical protein
LEAELNLDPDSNLDPNPDPESELITDPDPNLQIISDPDAQHWGQYQSKWRRNEAVYRYLHHQTNAKNIQKQRVSAIVISPELGKCRVQN